MSDRCESDSSDETAVVPIGERGLEQPECDQIAAWIVDLDGTLYYSTPVRLWMAFQLLLHGRESIAVIRHFRNEQEQMRGECESDKESPFHEQISRTSESLSLDRSEVASVVQDWMIRRPGPSLRRFSRRHLIGSIRRFRSNGGRTALVSDYPATDKLTSMGLSPDFDLVVANGEAGGPRRLKPAPDGLLLAAKRLGVEPERCLVIGDRQDVDGAAAQRAGMTFTLPTKHSLRRYNGRYLAGSQL